MICKLARYRIGAGAEPEVLEAVRDFVNAVRDAELCKTCRAYRPDDRWSFVHRPVRPDPRAAGRHRQASGARRLVDRLLPCCEAESQLNRIEPVAAAEVDGRS